LEIAHSLTTDSCIQAIRRFVARRGCPRRIYSDNGTNFVGAKNELEKFILELNQDDLIGECSTRGIYWYFNPPAAPHMGKSWERLVRTVKIALYSTLKEEAPRDEQLLTLMIEAENVVNSHPLTHVSINPEDEEALTPNHFLIGRSSNMQSMGGIGNESKNPRELWKNMRALAHQFRERWVKEYLPTLLRRTKWHQPCEPLQTGDIVLIIDPSRHRSTWLKGIVTKVFPGKDGQVRVADVKTAKGTYTRPAAKIAKLDIIKESSCNPEKSQSEKVLQKTNTEATGSKPEELKEEKI